MNLKDIKLTPKKIRQTNNIIYFTFHETESEIRYYKATEKIRCNCFNGSNMGVNDKQICYHKKYVKLFVDKYLKLMR